LSLTTYQNTAKNKVNQKKFNNNSSAVAEMGDRLGQYAWAEK